MLGPLDSRARTRGKALRHDPLDQSQVLFFSAFVGKALALALALAPDASRPSPPGDASTRLKETPAWKGAGLDQQSRLGLNALNRSKKKNAAEDEAVSASTTAPHIRGLQADVCRHLRMRACAYLCIRVCTSAYACARNACTQPLHCTLVCIGL